MGGKKGKVKTGSGPKKARNLKLRRAYNNESRQRSSNRNRQLIIETLVQLLVEKKGGEVTYREIAKRSGLAERSIFRFYNDKEELHREMERYLTSYIQSSIDKLASMDVAQFGKTSFALFDKYESLMLAYLYSPFGREARRLFRQRLNRVLIAKLREQRPDARAADLDRRLAIICSLINAKIWHDIRDDHGFSGEDMGTAVEWALRTLIKAL